MFFLQFGIGYLITIFIESFVLFFGLSARHKRRHRLIAGIWLSSCTLPLVWFVFPYCFDRTKHETAYLIASETFAPVAECLLFWLAFGKTEPRTRSALFQDMLVIIAANIASFGIGLELEYRGFWKWIGF